MSRLFSFLVLAGTVVTSTATSAQDPVEAHLAAIGGRKTLAGIKTIVRSGTVSGLNAQGEISGTFDEAIDLEKGRGYTTLQLEGFRHQTTWEGDSGWIQDSISGSREMPADELAIARLGVVPSPIWAIHQVYGPMAFRSQGETEFNGRRTLLVTVRESPIEFYIAPQSDLLAAMSVPGSFTVLYTSYHRIDGIQFPIKATYQIADQAVTLAYAYKSTKFNAELDESRFKTKAAKADSADRRVSAAQLVVLMDKDGDDRISKQEATEDLRLYFSDFDVNGDDAIDLSEARKMADRVNRDPAVATRLAEAPKGVTAKQLLSMMDLNGDGKIAEDEATGQVKAGLAYLDTNSDGGIDLREAQVMADYANQGQGGDPAAPPTGSVTAKQIVDSMDKNGDAAISKEEASEELRPYFRQQDHNGDGVIDVAEAQSIADYLNQRSKL